MTRYGIDVSVALRLAHEDLTIDPAHRLVAASGLRSQALSALYRDVRAGRLHRQQARSMLDRITALKIRLLGDRVSRSTAWRLAEELGWADIVDAEYVAVAQLQADAFVTLDADLAARVRDVVPVAPFDSLFSPTSSGPPSHR